MNFVVIDVETANADPSSICEVGIASFSDGSLHNSWESLVNPEDYFDPGHTSIHGIGQEKVRDSPKWAAVFPEVSSFLQGNIVVSHTAFDRVALLRACEKSKLAPCECRWLDSSWVVRRAWPTVSRSGYALENLAAEFGIDYCPHGALEDARCAGEILLRAIAETGLSIDQWLELVREPVNPHVKQPSHPRVERPIRRYFPLSVARDGNPDGPLYGEVMVFTGELSIPRDEAADAASAAGCKVAANVTKRTTLLVVGNRDVRQLAGYEKSSKHRKAEELIGRGQKIRIISEADFQRIVGLWRFKPNDPRVDTREAGRRDTNAPSLSRADRGQGRRPDQGDRGAGDLHGEIEMASSGTNPAFPTCGRCGAQAYAPGSHFCSRCGASLAGALNLIGNARK